MQTIIRHTVDTMAPSGLIRFPLGPYIGFPTVFIAGMVCALCIVTGPIGCLTLLSTPSKHEIHFLKLGVLMALYSKAHLENALVSMICGCCNAPGISWLCENERIPEFNSNPDKTPTSHSKALCSVLF